MRVPFDAFEPVAAVDEQGGAASGSSAMSWEVAFSTITLNCHLGGNMNSESRCDRHAALRAHLVAERLDAVGHRDAVAQQVLDAVGPGGRPDQRDGAVEDPDEVDRVVVRRLELEQDRCGQTRPMRAGCAGPSRRR